MIRQMITSRAARLVLVSVASVVAALALSASPALAAFGIQSFGVSFTNQNGSPDTRAGSHPWAATTTFALNTTGSTTGQTGPDGNVKDIRVTMPAGFVGDPNAIPQCTNEQLISLTFGGSGCPVDSQVGTLNITWEDGPGVVTQTGAAPLYNMVPQPGYAARFVMVFLVAPVYIDVSVPADNQVTATLTDVPEIAPVLGSTLTLWGVPADSSHDSQRICGSGPPCPSGVASLPYLTLPTSCNGPLTATISADSWQDQGDFQRASTVTEDVHGNPAGLTGCDSLPFTPSLSAALGTRAADSPTGLEVDVGLPQNDNPLGLAEADLRDASVTLPAGMAISPSAASGLLACSEAQIALPSSAAPTCPDASQIGHVEIDTPVLPNPLEGRIYLAQQAQNPFSSLLAMYLDAYDPVSGVRIKLAGRIQADPLTGQLKTTFSDNPQLPFSELKLDLFGGPRAVLVTPDACGTYTASGTFTPWSGSQAVTSTSSFQITSGCVAGFDPALTAGAENPVAGASTPLVLSFSRSDTDQELSGLSVTLPPGELAKLAGVQECTDAQLTAAAANSGAAEQASPSCPAGSQVGTVQTGAGPGPDPFFLSGNAYLTGPYKGAPYGLAVVVPVVAGPLDLGTVVVRQALYIDPTTAQVTDVSDPLPTILDGIPLRIRRIDIDLDRPNFTVNPTSCDPTQITGTLSAVGGLSMRLASRFQVGGCDALGFSPKLRIALSGKGKTRSGAHPTLTATLTDASGQANIRTAKVVLPLTLALDPNNSQHVCSYQVAQAVHGGPVGCPGSTIVGHATVVTPLLSQPLTGPVYLVQGIRFNKQGQAIHTLPSLLLPLRGQIAMDLRAQSSVNSAGALVTTFSTIPDAPVTKFVLTITGGPRGLLVITGRGVSICRSSQVANAQLGAQSGKRASSNVKVLTPCKAVGHAKRKHKSHTKRAKPRKHPRLVLADVAGGRFL